MPRFSYQRGVLVRIDGVQYRFVGRTSNGRDWQLVDTNTNLLITREIEELNDLYFRSRLILDPGDFARLPNKRLRTVPATISDLSAETQRKIRVNKLIIEEVARRTAAGTRTTKIIINGITTTPLKKALEEVCTENGVQKISVAKYYRLKKKLSATGDYTVLSGRSASSGHRQIHPRVKQIIIEEMHAVLEMAMGGIKRGVSGDKPMRSIIRQVEMRITAENQRTPELALRYPNRATYYNYWNKLPAFQRDVLKYGKTRARNMYRQSFGHEPREGCLELVEFDETELPVFIFDEALSIPLGRPTLCWYIDVYSRMILGIYLGFEPPSDLTIASALRHACLPKTYVKSEYPSIKNTWPAMGIPNFLVFDNSLSQHAPSVRNITLSLQTNYDFTPSRTPWFKSTVEGMFRTLNSLLLRELPGFVLGRMDGFDYDPTKNGCIGLRHFLSIFHHWLIDIYIQTPIGGRKSPVHHWNEWFSEAAPDLIGAAQELDVLFGITRKARLDHRGVVFENIRYFSDELQELRYQLGSRAWVSIKIDPSNLGKLHVWLPQDNAWISVPAVGQMRDEVESRSLHVHQIIRKYAREVLNRDDEDGRRFAEWKLHEMIANALPDAMSISANSKIARFMGVGTQHLFGSQRVTGELGPLSGPYTGGSLNPFRPQSVQEQNTGRSNISYANDEEGKAGPKQKRHIPKIPSDSSLGGLEDD